MNLISTPNSGRTLLIIASDKVNMQIMMQLIARRDDLNLMTSINGMEGMKLANTFLPEVVVLDTTLSDMCAREVLKCLRGNPMTSHIPVIPDAAQEPDSLENWHPCLVDCFQVFGTAGERLLPEKLKVSTWTPPVCQAFNSFWP